MPYILYKRDNGIDDDPHSFNSIMLRKLNDDITDENMIDPNDTPSSLLPKLNDMVQAMVMAEPTLTEEHALFHILHSPHGRKLAEHLNNLTKKDPPMIDLRKLIPITEDALMSTVVKRDGERFDTALRPEDDIDFRRDWQTITDVKHSLALSSTTKSMASLTPTSTEVGSSSVSDDSAEAVRQLQEMADKQRRTFTQVFEDPANRALANRTYTKHHLPGSA
jgi:hypothetical protein